MRKLVLIPIAAVALAACGKQETCVGHGGVQSVGKDATNSHVPVTCKDGYVFGLRL